MTISSPPHPCDVDSLEAARRRRLERAGLRVAPRAAEPTATFVAIELAILVLVSALAMVSVIVTTCSPAEARAMPNEGHSAAAERRVAIPQRPNADRTIASPAAIQ